MIEEQGEAMIAKPPVSIWLDQNVFNSYFDRVSGSNTSILIKKQSLIQLLMDGY